MRLAGAIILVSGALAGAAFGQPRPPLTAVEPGLERAVRWKWRVVPSASETWGLVAPVVPLPREAAPAAPGEISASRPDAYVVKRGDALFTISRRFKVPLDILKSVNGLTSDTIRVGQTLRIPSPEEVAVLRPAVPTPPPKGPVAPKNLVYDPAALRLQVYLDRALFPAGPIDGQPGPALEAARQRHAAAHPDFTDAALADFEPLTTYTLRAEDFRFIAPPRAQAVTEPAAAPGKKGKPAEHLAPKPTYDDLIGPSQLVYRTPWEFLAERFHCQEAFLRRLNAHIRGVPTVGDELRVPNVAPFEIERVPALAQPAADPAVTAAVVDRSRLEISRAGRVVAVLPLSIARPRLTGRGTWKILDLIPRPLLATRRELLYPPQAPTRIYGRPNPEETPPPTPTPLPRDEIIAAGPNSPVGILWIPLARADDPTPLPYGLTGTSIPDEMITTESVGGLRLANWDIARVVRLLPPGTPLEWRTGPAVPARPPIAPATPP